MGSLFYYNIFKMSLLLSSHVVRAFFIYMEGVWLDHSPTLKQKGMNNYSKKYRQSF